jgi:predicted ATP-grasp superfamily ATP-dependent carboligase
MRILVTDSDTRAALAAVRALGARGHEVVTAGIAHPSIASVSRHSSAFEPYPNPAEDSEAFLGGLAEITRRRRIDVVLPMTEVTTLLVTAHQNELSGRIPFPDTATVRNASDKAFVIGLATELGIPVPRTHVATSVAHGVELGAALGFPVVMKPSRSRVRTATGWVSTGVAYATDAGALRAALESLSPEVYPVLLQERIEGPGVGVFAAVDRGKTVALFAHRRLREKPPSGGVSVLCESAAVDPVAAEHAAKLLSHIGWRGVAMVEFKQDSRDGSLRLMEINGRFWGSLQLSIDAGVDFPNIAAGIAMGHEPGAPPAYRIGVRSRWLAGDIDALLLQLFKSRRSLNLPASHPGRWRALASFLNPFGRAVRYELERRDDFAPARLEWSRRIVQARKVSSPQVPHPQKGSVHGR